MVSFTRGTVAQSMISKYPSGYNLAGASRLFRCLSGSATQHNHRVVSVPSAPSCSCFCPNLTGFSSRGHSHPHKLAFAEHRLELRSTQSRRAFHLLYPDAVCKTKGQKLWYRFCPKYIEKICREKRKAWKNISAHSGKNYRQL